MLRPTQDIEDIAAHVTRTHDLSEADRMSLAIVLLRGTGVRPEVAAYISEAIGESVIAMLPGNPATSTYHGIKSLVDELRGITDPAALKTDTQSRQDFERAAAICRLFKVDYPEDVFDRYGKYGQHIPREVT